MIGFDEFVELFAASRADHSIAFQQHENVGDADYALNQVRELRRKSALFGTASAHAA